MKSRQLLSVVLSLIMVFGITAGSAFAQTDDELDDNSIDNDNIDDTTVEDDTVDVIDSFDDCVEAGYPVMESYPEKCMTDDGTVFVNEKQVDDYDDDRYAKGDKFYVCHNGNTISIAESAVREHLGHGDSMKKCPDAVRDSDRDYDRDYVKDVRHYDLDDRLDYFCDMTNDEKRQFFEDHPRLEQFSDRLVNYCDLSDDERDDKLRDFVRDHVSDEDRDRNIDKDMRHKLDKYCDMSDIDKREYIAEHDKTTDKAAKMDRFCTLNETDRMDFIKEHRDEYKAYMKDKKHMDYDRLCSMAASDRASEITDESKLDKITEWCNMTPEEREEYKMKHHDGMKDSDKMRDKMDKKSDKHPDKMMKFSDMSPRLKAMITDKRDISDERHDEIRMKFEEKHGADSDKKRTEIKMKYKDHKLKMEFKMSDERKSDVHDRLAEMKAYKLELRERSSDITDKEKQQLREEFIEKAKDMHLAWISPRVQMTAGVDAAEVECREGFSLVMKTSNGVAMCLKADSALRMIDKGIAIPAT